MARPRSPVLTDAELRPMEILWEQGPATVAEVQQALQAHRLSYSTVLTTLRILETKGYVRHTKMSHAYVYEPVIPRDEARRQALNHLLSRLFQNSREELMLNLFRDRDLTPEEGQKLRELVEQIPVESESAR